MRGSMPHQKCQEHRSLSADHNGGSQSQSPGRKGWEGEGMAWVFNRVALKELHVAQVLNYVPHVLYVLPYSFLGLLWGA